MSGSEQTRAKAFGHDIPMPTRNVRLEALQRAYHAVDQDIERLRLLLDVPVTALLHWLEGRTQAPLPVFLRAVDVILEANAEHVEKRR